MNGTSTPGAYAPVVVALDTMQGHGDSTQKGRANEFLEQWQKSMDAWSTAFTMLQDSDLAPATKVFAAVTLKGKIIYDLHTLPREALPQLRDQLMRMLAHFKTGPKPIRTQLSVSLANLAIQMTEWKSVLQDVVTALGTDPEGAACGLEFLRVLPEEFAGGQKILMTEDELSQRSDELLIENSNRVLKLLIQYATQAPAITKNPLFLECLTSWMREIPLNDIVNTVLLSSIVNGLSDENTFQSAVDCLCSIFQETRDVDECLSTINTVYPHVIALRPRLAEAAKEEDAETYKGYTRIFAEAGEAWVLLIARLPQEFRGLVEAVLESAALDREHEAIGLTFLFWYELKQYLTLEKYAQARMQFVPLYSNLVDITIAHLQYPIPESGNERDLFEGDRAQEDRFREFRHRIGDVLKDACEVIGVEQCLGKSYTLIDQWIKKHGAQAQDGKLPEWQKLEAPICGLRSMGSMVPPDESVMVPQIIPLLVQIPDHEKVRFQAVMTLGRYTEWTAEHPETLQPQLNFIMASFDNRSKDVMRAAALAFKFFCNDCAKHLTGFISQLQQFYSNILDRLPPSGQEEVTEGVASVVALLPREQLHDNLKIFCDPLGRQIVAMGNEASTQKQIEALADKIQLLTIFVQQTRASHDEKNESDSAVKYCLEIFPVLSSVANRFVGSVAVLERVCRCWRHMVLSYHTSCAPLLPSLAENLGQGFVASKQGCFLWATDAIVREFSEGTAESTQEAVFAFFQQQATNFLRILSDLPPEQLSDVIEDFFRLLSDVIRSYPYKAISSHLMAPILQAAYSSLSLMKEEPLMAILHFLRDLLAWGGPEKPISDIDFNGDVPPNRSNSVEMQTAVKQLMTTNGPTLVQRVLTGMMYSFPRDCFPDASGVMLQLFQLLPQETAHWVQETISLLPSGSVTPQERDRLITNIGQRIQSNEVRKIRPLLQDFTNSYRRRNVAPREGLGRLEATRFRFAG